MGAIKEYYSANIGPGKKPGRLISYVNIPSFSLAIESHLDPALQHRPVVLASPFVKDARVLECSPLVKDSGVSKGMLLSQARLLCPDVRVVQSRDEVYDRIAAQLEADIQKMIPVFERENKGKGFIDYTGLQGVHGSAERFHQQLRERIQFRYCLNPDIGISCNKLVSKIAAKNIQESAKDSLLFVHSSDVKKFLAPLPVEFLPIVSEITQRQVSGRWDVLDDLNLMFIEDLQRLSVGHLEVAFGKIGQVLHQFSQGIDSRPVVASMEKSSLFFDVDFPLETNNCRVLFGHLNELIDEGLRELQEYQKCADSCVVSLRYSGGDFKEFLIKPKELIFQKIHLEKELLRIMEKMGERRLAIKWMQVEYKGVQKQGVQLSLFTDKKENLFKEVNRIEKRFSGKILTFSKKMESLKKNE
jgi:DNA polymerase IV